MSQTDISTKEKYYNYVNYTVDVMEEEYDLENEDLTEMVFREANHADIIIYNSYNMDILQNSNNEPIGWKYHVHDDAEWYVVIQAMSLDVFRQDLREELRNRGY